MAELSDDDSDAIFELVLTEEQAKKIENTKPANVKTRDLPSRKELFNKLGTSKDLPNADWKE